MIVVAIKNFEMPKDCDSCPFYTYYANHADDCRITGEELQNVKLGERHPGCPLVDVEFDYQKECFNKNLSSLGVLRALAAKRVN